MKINTRENRLKLLNMLRWIPDKAMISLQFRLTMKKKLNLASPQTFNEKLQWLKLYDRNPLHTMMADKYLVREFVKEIIGEDYLIPLLGHWDRYEAIDFSKLPDDFVLKCNHDSGSIKIVHGKNNINHMELAGFLNQRLKQNPYSYGREWPYKNIKPCIIAEKYMGNADGALPVDYKFFCFSGKVDSVMVCTERGTQGKRFFFFDREWNLKKYNNSSLSLPDDFQIEKPAGIEDLFALCEKLSKNEKFVRIDFYVIDGKPYFGEFTFFPASGFDHNLVEWADLYLGEQIDLRMNAKKQIK